MKPSRRTSLRVKKGCAMSTERENAVRKAATFLASPSQNGRIRKGELLHGWALYVVLNFMKEIIFHHSYHRCWRQTPPLRGSAVPAQRPTSIHADGKKARLSWTQRFQRLQTLICPSGKLNMATFMTIHLFHARVWRHQDVCFVLA